MNKRDVKIIKELLVNSRKIIVYLLKAMDQEDFISPKEHLKHLHVNEDELIKKLGEI